VKRLLGAIVLVAPRLAGACPACASATKSFNATHLVLLVLPFVIALFAIRAILRALDD
jgi:hypothetical protein